jgi:hypothetical protein
MLFHQRSVAVTAWVQAAMTSRPKVGMEVEETAPIVEALASALADSPASDLARLPTENRQAPPKALCRPAWPRVDDDKIRATS